MESNVSIINRPASDFLFRALEAVSSCDCLEGCENCELSGQLLRCLFHKGEQAFLAASVGKATRSGRREVPWWF